MLRERERERHKAKGISFFISLRKILRGSRYRFIIILDKRNIDREKGREGRRGGREFSFSLCCEKFRERPDIDL